MSKLSNVVKNEVVKKTVYDKLVAKVNNIDTKRFVLKTKYGTYKLELEKKIPDVRNLVKNFDLSYFIGKNYFDQDVTQNYLVFQSILE